MKSIFGKQFWYLLGLLLATDIAFIFLSGAYECKRLSFIDGCQILPLDSYFSIVKDRGYAEVFQYIKEYWLIILFGVLAITNRGKIYFAWALLFGYVLLDDAFKIHETLGFAIGEKLSFLPLLGLRAQDYGEITVFAVSGLFFMIIIGWGYYWGDFTERNISKYLIGLMLIMAFFGIIVDLIHVPFLDRPIWDVFFSILEDGGEHFAMSLILGFVYSISLPTQEELRSKLKEIN